MRYRGLSYAIRNRCLTDYLRWVLTGTSPRTRSIDIQSKLVELRNRKITDL